MLVRQYQHPTFREVPYKLSEADRANGYVWVGDTILTTTLWRNLVKEGDGKWTAEGWQPGTREQFEAVTRSGLSATAGNAVLVPDVARVITMWKRGGDWHFGFHEKVIIYSAEMNNNGDLRGWYSKNIFEPPVELDVRQVSSTRLPCVAGNIVFAGLAAPSAPPVPQTDTRGSAQSSHGRSSSAGSFGPDAGKGLRDSAGVYHAGGGVTPPVLVKRVDPAYSEEARAAKYTGSVLLSVVVDEHGSVRSASVIKSLGMGLDEKAEEAVLKWTFKPGTKDGKPVSVSVQVEVN